MSARFGRQLARAAWPLVGLTKLPARKAAPERARSLQRILEEETGKREEGRGKRDFGRKLPSRAPVPASRFPLPYKPSNNASLLGVAAMRLMSHSIAELDGICWRPRLRV